MRRAILCTFLSATLLTGCSNLTAQLIGGDAGGKQLSYTTTYAREGQQHDFKVTFTVKDRKILDLAIEPQASSGRERGEQLAFSANVRSFVLGYSVDAIVIPTPFGLTPPELVAAFLGTIEQLKKDA